MGILIKTKKILMTAEYLDDKAAYDAAIAASKDKPLCIDYTATWCPPCKMIGPKFETMAGEFPNVTLRKVDVDKNSEAAQAAGINCMPTFKFYKNGAEVEADKIEGANEEKIRIHQEVPRWRLNSQSLL